MRSLSLERGEKMTKHLYQVTGFKDNGEYFVAFYVTNDNNKIISDFRDIGYSVRDIRDVKQVPWETAYGMLGIKIFNNHELIKLIS